jgi:hypothetical protein
MKGKRTGNGMGRKTIITTLPGISNRPPPADIKPAALCGNTSPSKPAGQGPSFSEMAKRSQRPNYRPGAASKHTGDKKRVDQSSPATMPVVKRGKGPVDNFNLQLGDM